MLFCFLLARSSRDVFLMIPRIGQSGSILFVTEPIVITLQLNNLDVMFFGDEFDYILKIRQFFTVRNNVNG